MKFHDCGITLDTKEDSFVELRNDFLQGLNTVLEI